MIYFLSFLWSIGWIWIGEHLLVKSKQLFFFISIIGLIGPVFIYASRDNSVGFDVGMYVEPVFSYSTHCKSFRQLYEYFKENIDALYLSLNFFVTRLTNDIFWIHFLIQSIISGCYFCFAFNNRKKAPIWAMMGIFYLLIYCVSINIVRQNMAMGFVLLAYDSVLKYKKKNAFIYFLIAFLFHRTSVLAFAAVYGVLFIINRKNKYWRLFFLGAMYLVFLAIVVLAKDLLMSLLDTGANSVQRYSAFLDRDSGNTIAKLDVFLRLIFCFFLYINLKKKVFPKREILFYLHMTMIGVFFLFMNLILPQSSRLSMYFQILLIGAIPELLVKSKYSSSYKRINTITIFTLLLIGLFIQNVIVHGLENGDIMPYKSKYLGISK